LGLTLAFSAVSHAQPAGGNGVKGFFSNIVGEWIGTCQQSTDGKQADNKYFHMTKKQVDGSTFAGQLEYYRVDRKTGTPLHIGDSTVTTTVDGNGLAHSKILGKGTVLINETESKNEQHDFQEVVSAIGGYSLQGQGSGKISVAGMPLGVGKNGKVKDSKSAWSLSNGILSIRQTLNVGFKAFFVSKSFSIAANYTAKRGSDVFGLMGKGPITARPTKAVRGRS
jgi:hypothetical protein